MNPEVEKIVESLAHLASSEDHLVYLPDSVAFLESIRKQRQALTRRLYAIIGYDPKKENSELHCILKHLLVAQINLREGLQRWESEGRTEAVSILDDLTDTIFTLIEQMSTVPEEDVLA